MAGIVLKDPQGYIKLDLQKKLKAFNKKKHNKCHYSQYHKNVIIITVQILRVHGSTARRLRLQPSMFDPSTLLL